MTESMFPGNKYKPETRFHVGDVVRLNSGSIDMTVVIIHTVQGEISYTCEWFAPNNYTQVFSHMFPSEALTSADDDSEVEEEDTDG